MNTERRHLTFLLIATLFVFLIPSIAGTVPNGQANTASGVKGDTEAPTILYLNGAQNVSVTGRSSGPKAEQTGSQNTVERNLSEEQVEKDVKIQIV